MAIVKCDNCGKEIAHEYRPRICPECGHIMKPHWKKEQKKTTRKSRKKKDVVDASDANATNNNIEDQSFEEVELRLLQD